MRKNKKKYRVVISVLIAVVLASVIAIGVVMHTNRRKQDVLSRKTTDTVAKKPMQKNEASATVSPKQETQVVPQTNVQPPVKEEPKENPNVAYRYGKYSLVETTAPSTKTSFYFGRNKDFQRPSGALPEETFKKYNSYYIGPDKKVIYLTFDEGYPNSQASKNLDTLKKHGIKATFFLTKGFIDANPDIVKRMVNEGQVIGNHTVNHKDMATMALENPEQFIKEIADTEDDFKSVTGKEMDKVFRFPEGTFSERALDFLNQMGYRSIFWSFAYVDWEPTANTREEALSWLEGYYHPGAIYLIHGANVADADALDEFITYMEGLGYSFDVPTDI